MEIDDAFKEHIRGIIEDLSDLEPMQQRYRADILIEEDDEVSLIEFIKTFYAVTKIKPDSNLIFLENYIEPYDNMEAPTDQHQEVVVPYGPAILAMLGDPDLVSDYNLDDFPNPGIRLLVAHFSSDSLLLDHLSYDRCALVRAEVVTNKNSNDETKKRLKYDPFIHVRHLGGEVEGESSLVKSLDLEICACTKVEANEDFDDFFSVEHSLEYPPLTVEFEEEITEFGFWHWATQPFPDRMQDYSLIESVEYLKGPVPDQYSLNHAGHGINSYSLNFRHVFGNIAIFAQSGYGGVYMSTRDQERDWDELQSVLAHILLDHAHIGVSEKNEIKVRKYLIVYSRFRLGDSPELWQNDEGTWTHVETVRSWEDVSEFLNMHNG
jgi:hypothetical protein